MVSVPYLSRSYLAALPTWLRTMATGVGRASPSARFCVGLARGSDDSVVLEGPGMIRCSAAHAKSERDRVLTRSPAVRPLWNVRVIA